MGGHFYSREGATNIFVFCVMSVAPAWLCFRFVFVFWFVLMVCFACLYFTTQENHTRLFGLRKELVAFCISKGMHRGIHISWGDMHARLITKNVVQVSTESAGDEIVLLTDYIEDHGDPHTNGKGHKVIQHEGHTCVEIPGKMKWTRKKARIEPTEKITELASSESEFRAGQLDDMFNDVSANLFAAFPRAKGQAMALVAPSWPPAASPDGAKSASFMPSPANAQTPDAACDDDVPRPRSRSSNLGLLGRGSVT